MTVTFTGDSAEVVLSISAEMPDGNWADASFNLALDSDNADIAVTRSRAVVHVLDANPQPVAEFSKSSITLNEDSSTTVNVSVDGDDEPAGDLDGHHPACSLSWSSLLMPLTPTARSQSPSVDGADGGMIEDGSFDVGGIGTLSHGRRGADHHGDSGHGWLQEPRDHSFVRPGFAGA